MKRCIVGLTIKNITIIQVGTTKSFINVIKAGLGKRFCNLRIRPIILFILHSTVSKGFSKDNRVSKIVPRCIWDVACVTLLLLLLLLLLINASDMRYCFRFPTKNDFLCLLFWMWVKTHFLMKGLSIYPCQVVISSKAEVLLS